MACGPSFSREGLFVCERGLTELWNNCKNPMGAVDFRWGRGIVGTEISTRNG